MRPPLMNFGTVVINNTYSRLERSGDSLRRENVHLRLYQARNSNLSKTTLGNLGIVTELSEEPKVLSFVTDSLRYSIINGEENPYNFTYMVDIEVLLREGSSYLETHKDVKGYQVLSLHGSVENRDLLST